MVWDVIGVIVGWECLVCAERVCHTSGGIVFGGVLLGIHAFVSEVAVIVWLQTWLHWMRWYRFDCIGVHHCHTSHAKCHTCVV